MLQACVQRKAQMHGCISTVRVVRIYSVQNQRGEGEDAVRCGGGRDDRVSTVVINCDKGDCGQHTERDLVDFKIHIIDTSYLKATRKKKQE